MPSRPWCLLIFNLCLFLVAPLVWVPLSLSKRNGYDPVLIISRADTLAFGSCTTKRVVSVILLCLRSPPLAHLFTVASLMMVSLGRTFHQGQHWSLAFCPGASLFPSLKMPSGSHSTVLKHGLDTILEVHGHAHPAEKFLTKGRRKLMDNFSCWSFWGTTLRYILYSFSECPLEDWAQTAYGV